MLDDLLAFVVDGFHVKPAESLAFLFPNRGEVQRQAYGIIQLGLVVALDGPIELLDIVFGVFVALLRLAGEHREKEGKEDKDSFHVIAGLEREG